MDRRRFLGFGGSSLLLACASSRAPAAAPEAEGPITIHIAGDSTAARFEPRDPRVGWGVVFAERFEPGVSVDNRARSGRSTKSYIDEGSWAALLAVLAPSDPVFIGFGHNDEKSEDPARYTDAATTFRDNLERMVRDVQTRSADPILLTPISRLKFDGAAIAPSHGDYPEAVEAVAMETDTPLIDLTEKTKQLFEQLGPEKSLALFAQGDQTHTCLAGARDIAQLVAQSLIELGHPLAKRLKAG